MTRNRDPYSFADTFIDVLHRNAHDGFVHHVSGKVTGMVDTNVDDYLLQTNSGVPHFQRMRIAAGRGDIDIAVYEAAVVSAAGSEIVSGNTNRFSANVAATKVYTGPTVTDPGDLIHTTWMPPTGTGTGLSATGLVGETNGEEWILTPGTNYLIRITNNSGATIDYSYEMLWYEMEYPTL